MPLLRQEPFVKKKVPRNLNDSDNVFYLELTEEIFTNYEEYCYRIIQCNSLVWSCGITNKPELTYAEALDSERNAKETLASFPFELKRPALYLASTIETSSLQKIVTDIYNFMKDRYFLNEIVVPKTKENWEEGEIVGVRNPSAQTVNTLKRKSTQKNAPPGNYLYDVLSNFKIHQVYGAKIKRRANLTKDTLMLLIKHNVELNSKGIWVVKRCTQRKYSIEYLKFSQVFTGDPPVFTKSADKGKGSTEAMVMISNFKESEKSPSAKGSKQSLKPVTPNQKQKANSTQRSRSVPPNKKLRKWSEEPNANKERSYSVPANSKAKSVSSFCKKENSRQRELKDTPKRVTTNQKSNINKLVKQTGQQNIDKYFIVSTKSNESNNDTLNEVRGKSCDCHVESEKRNDLKSESTLTLGSKKLYSETGSPVTLDSRHVDSEAETTCSFGTKKFNSEPGFPHKNSQCKFVKISTEEDLQVLWSNVSPNSQLFNQIEKYGTENSALALRDAGKSSTSVSRVESRDTSKKPCTSNSEPKVTVKKKVSIGANTKRSRDDDDEGTVKRRSKKPNLSIEEQGSSERQLSTTKRVLKQSRMIVGPKDCESTNQLQQSLSRKKAKKYSGLGRKQKVVGTLKPWVQATKKGDTPPKGAVEAAPVNSSRKEVKKNWLEVQKEQELQNKLKKQEERRQMKLKQEEEKIKFASFMKEWKKHREDLLCEDLKPLPPTCDINCQISSEYFGDFMIILEFFHNFNNILKVKSFFPCGLSFEYLERALVETEIAGPLNGIIHVLLMGIFNMQVTEYEKPKSGVPVAVDRDLDTPAEQNITMEEAIPTGWSNIFQGVPLNAIPINHTTISEVLRLHLLGSGGRAWDPTSKWSDIRGGYSDLEDPGLWLRFENPLILKKLSHQHICELSVGEKLEILTCLVNQILTYASVRDKLDALCEQTRKEKASFRSLQVAELKLQKEAASRRFQAKKEAKLSKLSLPESASHNVTSQEEFESEIQKLEKEIAKIKASILKKGSRILPLTMSHQLLPIGCDRAHRRYWLFSSLPGLFVEMNPFEVGQCLPHPTPQASELADTLTHVRRLFEEESHSASNDKENDIFKREISKPLVVSPKKMLIEQNKSVQTLCNEKGNSKTDLILENESMNETEILVCTASDKCCIHGPSGRKVHWSFFPKKEDVSALLECLNERGIRESALRHVIMQEQQRIVESITLCPIHKLNPEKFQSTDADREQRKSTRNFSGYSPESARLNYPPTTSVSHIMEWTMRKLILELETKINSSNVGSLKVYDRLAWRTAIEDGGYEQQCNKLDWGFKRHYSLQTDEGLSNSSGLKERNKLQDCEEPNNIDNEEEAMKKIVELEDDGQEEEEEMEDIEDEIVESDRGHCEEDATQQLQESDYETSGESIIEEMNSQKEESANEAFGDSSVGETNQQMEESDYEISGESTVGEMNQQSEESDNETAGSENKEDEDESNEKGNMTEYRSDKETNDGDELGSMPESQIQCVNRSDVDSEYGDRVQYDNSRSEFHNHQNIEGEPADTETDEISKPGNGTLSQNVIVKELACAILQLGQSIDPKFLKKPLASGDRIRKTAMKYWEVSLMNAINFSQLFIHHKFLENNIIWTKSPCCICQQRRNADKIVFCDGCNRGHHIYCLKPKLKTVPKDDWFCPNCIPGERRSSRIREQRNVLEDTDNFCDISSTRNRKRKLYSNDESNDEILIEEHSKSRKENEEICKKCAQTGIMLYCTTCSIGYHKECVNLSRTRHQQKENWQCDECKFEMQSSKSDGGEIYVTSDEEEEETEINDDKRYQRAAEFHPRQHRGCATTTLAKIATFTKRLRTSSWDDDGESSQEANLSETIHDDDDYVITEVRRSSRRSLVASDDLPLDNAVLQNLLKDLLNHEDAWPFRKPVRKSEAPDYHYIIKKPMDLGTVKYKLNTAEYCNNAEFIADILLIFENCFMYNRDHTVEYKCSGRLLKYFGRRSHELGLI